MSEKRFVIDEEGISDNKTEKWYCWKEEVVELLNEQQATINRLQSDLKDYNEIKDNWESMVEKTTEISLRNVELVEENARLQRKIDWLCEIFDFGSDESMEVVRQKDPKWFDENCKTKVVKSIK